MDKVEIIPVKSFADVLRAALVPEFSHVADKFDEVLNTSNQKLVQKQKRKQSNQKGTPSI